MVDESAGFVDDDEGVDGPGDSQRVQGQVNGVEYMMDSQTGLSAVAVIVDAAFLGIIGKGLSCLLLSWTAR